MKKCSVLRDFVQNLDYNENINDLKRKSIEHVKMSNISDTDKHKMCVYIAQMQDTSSLARYLFNALLKFEGHGVI